METIKNPRLTSNSKVLRKNMTKQERHLWYDFLKQLPVTVHRQKVYGPFILDFYIPCANLVIELDGSQHFEEAGKASDRERDLYLQERQLTVLRYSNLDVMQNFMGVCEDIIQHIPSFVDLGSFR